MIYRLSFYKVFLCQKMPKDSDPKDSESQKIQNYAKRFREIMYIVQLYKIQKLIFHIEFFSFKDNLVNMHNEHLNKKRFRNDLKFVTLKYY